MSAPLFATRVRFWSFLLSHIENDLKRILQKKQNKKIDYIQSYCCNSYNSLSLFCPTQVSSAAVTSFSQARR